MAYLSEGSKVGGKQIETVDGAQAKVNALKNNEIEPLKTRVSNAEKSINQISNEVSTKVSRTEFESLEIGGRNLLRNSDFSQGKTWWTGISEIVDGYKGYKGAVLERSGYSGSDRVFLSHTHASEDLLTEGETYTLSGWFYIDSSIPLDSKNNSFLVRKYQSGTTGAYRDFINFSVTLDEFSYDTWYYFKATGTVPKGYNGREQVSFALGKNGRIIVSALKLEKGNKATDWTPAIEDAEVYVKQKAQEVIDAVEIGGRNLLKSSRLIRPYSNDDSKYPISYTLMTEGERQFYRVVRRNTQSHPTRMSLYNAIPVTDITQDLQGKTVTFSFRARASHNVSSDLFLYFDGGSNGRKNLSYHGSTFQITTSWKTFAFTVDIDFSIYNSEWLRFTPWQITIPSGEIDNFYLDICEFKIEIGSKATDWTPAPEDIFQEITNVKNSSAPISHVGSGGNAHALATPSAHGFMSSSDKAKLDGIQAGAEVNQNTFSTIKVGNTNVVADSKSDTLELVAGTNVVLTPDATNDRITIGLSSNVETVSGAQAKANAVQANLNAHIGSGGNAHALATTSNHGFMSRSDKSKLDGIQAGAEVNQNAFTHIKVGSTTVSADSKTDTLELVAGTNVVLTPDATNDKITIGLSGNVETTSGAQAKVNAHANRKDNPHNVTSEQINLISTVTDASISGDSYPIGLTVFYVGTNSTGYPHTYGTVFTIKYNNTRLIQWFFRIGSVGYTEAWFRHWHTDYGWTSWQKVATTEDVNSHANRKDNPHGVTKAQVGLGSVENYGIATQAEAEAGTANNKYMTPLRTMQLLNKKIHVGSSPPSNPRQGDLWIW